MTPSGLSPHLKTLAIFFLLLGLPIVTFPASWGWVRFLVLL